MDNELVYSIGETLLLEMDSVKNVTYPAGENPTVLLLELSGGERYSLTVQRV